jgi:hypothetical protein
MSAAHGISDAIVYSITVVTEGGRVARQELIVDDETTPGGHHDQAVVPRGPTAKHQSSLCVSPGRPAVEV